MRSHTPPFERPGAPGRGDRLRPGPCARQAVNSTTEVALPASLSLYDTTGKFVGRYATTVGFGSPASASLQSSPVTVAKIDGRLVAIPVVGFDGPVGDPRSTSLDRVSFEAVQRVYFSSGDCSGSASIVMPTYGLLVPGARITAVVSAADGHKWVYVASDSLYYGSFLSSYGSGHCRPESVGGTGGLAWAAVSAVDLSTLFAEPMSLK